MDEKKQATRGSHNRGKRAREKAARNESSSEKKPSARTKKKFSALNPRLNLKSRTEELTDILSYFDQLNDEEKEWMNRFTEEYVHANFNHTGERLHPVEYVEYERLNGDVYTADKYVKASNDKNNARNRCLYNKCKMGNNLKSFDNVKEDKVSSIRPTKEHSGD